MFEIKLSFLKKMKNVCEHKTGLICTVSSVDGAILSQMSEVKSTPKVITTCESQGRMMSPKSSLLLFKIKKKNDVSVPY